MAANATAGSSRQPKLKQQARMMVTLIKDTKVKDASVARAVTMKKPKAIAAKRKTEPKEFNISLTLGIAGVDVPGKIFDKLQNYLEEKATMAIMAFERGDAHLLLHIQSMFTIKTTSTLKLKEDIRAAVGWKDTASLGTPCMIRSGQYMPGLKWATMKPMSQLRVERIWQACVAPETITVTDTDYILFGQSHNDRYFSSSHRMELLIAEARKRKDDDDGKDQERGKAPKVDEDDEDGSKANEREQTAADTDGHEEREIPEAVLGNNATVQQIHDRNENLQQPRAPGSPDDEFDADELPDVVDLDDIIEPGMDAEVLMYDLLAAGYGVRRRRPAGPEQRNDHNNDQQEAANAARNVIPANNNGVHQDEIPDCIPLVRPPS
ncbi:hypothetical protein R1sor_027420 [Riccia sorocarpa]|uniref:Uncharacterized protein n=1 Tax=Riccia sorocarpa TaxID=122646 RepID=A0ABD3GFW0_9MARC